MTVLDNVIASAFMRATTKTKAAEAAEEVLRFTGLYEDRGLVSKGLPLGKRKRLEIARALATRPELILLDESFAGLNPTEINEQIEIVRRDKRERNHDPDHRASHESDHVHFRQNCCAQLW